MKNLGKIMKEKKVTGYELSKRSGVSTSHISDILRGKKQAGIVIAQKLAKGLCVTVAELIDEQTTTTERQAG